MYNDAAMLEFAGGPWGSVPVGVTLWGGMQADGKSDMQLTCRKYQPLLGEHVR